MAMAMAMASWPNCRDLGHSARGLESRFAIEAALIGSYG